ncbi:telomere-associated protein RIF1 [Sitodiplosis mosellana]|uniref:telomere-associated protein RIF1 n=1 Tax=Sitodiplosis mosellana TaxID=263140 RepID=UPI002444F61F|nr:telomere-associated protein RIF1 [Sitodiplosis mosellana]XP_055318971.1 telomere-associated protein RIF1 [Sitodiplosis mosellana]XP_055318972.1 telomere-associated protein RIF1 [Sitodiplosis mosellana]XP_055318973.1 telomere-associated protein RIF1 [Sitodiplosis mosellana]XP_055318974.1 telomere-associated protein RIF1 [Sitodiplosis mosellana]XP_055318975.1 telomere-associated protein RIF1 [Sitodiplosis mosellana]XP_055318976.1 telomere-associated protein RIF1 [Sitodiplosis mosellana]XP_0
MSLPSVAKERTANKVSLVTRPSVTLVQPVQVIGSSASSQQPTLIYVQSIQTIQPASSTTQPQQLHQQQNKPAYITTKVNKPKSLSQPVTIAPIKTHPRSTINKLVAVPSTSSSSSTSSLTISKRLQTFQLKTPNTVVTTNFHQSKPTIVGQTIVSPRIVLNDKQTVAKITKVSTATPLASIAPKRTTTITTTTAAPTATIKGGLTIERFGSSSSNSTTASTTSTHNKTAALNVAKLDPVKFRYRTILENLLQLKNNFIRRTITQAIQQKLANQSNEDLLNVIFKSFELTLLSVNVDQIYLNETYLNATLAFLAKVIETGRFMELIENRKETKNIGRFVTSEMSSILNKVSLESVYKNARDIFEKKQRGSYAQILELLIKVINCVKVSPETKMSPVEIEFWLKEVVPLIFDTDDDIQTNAIEAVNRAMPLLLASRYQSHPQWQRVRFEILSDYTKKINACFRQGNPKWYLAWCLCVRLLDVDIPRSASTLNAFLSIVEPALRSNVPIRRAEGYLCWRALLEVLVRHNRLNSEKRLKLMCTPLKSLQAKTVEIATNKFQAWWYVVCNVQENVENYISMVFEPFLHFCFGPLFRQPDLHLQPNEAATQVKSFSDVSLMAIATLLRIFDESDKQIDELFAKFSLDHPKFAILTETIFNIESTSAFIINACGEATMMLNRLRNNANNNIDCITLAVCLWTRLFKHVNKVKNAEHINRILDNVSQLLKLNSLDPNQTRMIPVICASILGNVSTSFIFDRNEGDIITDDTIKAIAKLMNTLIQLPSMQSRFNESLSKLMAVPQDANLVVPNFTHFLTEIHEQFFKNDNQAANTGEINANKLTISCEFIDGILQYIHTNSEQLKETLSNSKTTQIPQVFYNILYWPLSMALNRNEFDVYTKILLKAIDLLLTVISKWEFCKESAKTVKTIIANPAHCIYINDTIATLFEYMVYDFDELKSAPLDMLNLCGLLIKKDSKVMFQDLNSITEALIKYRRAISQKQFEIIAPKLRDVIRLIDGEKSNLRTEASLIKDLKEMVGDEIKTEKSPGQGKKSLRSAKNKDEFVVVNKVWKLEPSKLTEHQKEKMKTRRCDIPALYNDLSQSQDSASIQAWAPKAVPTSTDSVKNESNEKSAVAGDSIESKFMAAAAVVDSTATIIVPESPSSQRTKKIEKSAKTSPKRSSQSQSDNCGDRKSDGEKDASSDEIPSKRRVTRELNRIQIDAKIEEVPYNSLPESNRLTRSTIKKIEEKPDSEPTKKIDDKSEPEKRKTRSESVKPATPDVVKKKITRASLANSPVPVKVKSKLNAKAAVNSADNEATGESTPKRRLTRQSKTDDSDLDESIVQSNSIQKVEHKKTEFKDTLELKVEKLPTYPSSKPHSEKSDIENAKVDTKEEPKGNAAEQTSDKAAEAMQQNENNDDGTAMEVDEPIAAESVPPTENVDEQCETVNETPEPLKIQPIDEDNKMETEVEQNAQILVATETIPNGIELIENECGPDNEDNGGDDDDGENNILSRSYMSALVFDGISPSKSLNGSTIVTSPEIGAPRSLEFLNDTLNISPIIQEAEKVENSAKKKIVVEGLDEAEKVQETVVAGAGQEYDGKTDKPLVSDEIISDKESAVKKESENENTKNVVAQRTAGAAVVPVAESPVVSSSKQLNKTPHVIQSSTPIQSHHSPVSSKFKTQLMGRGAQLLKMINSNKSPKPASPTPTAMAENAFVSITKTGSPAINQLETAPIFENVMHTPEPKMRPNERNEQNENGNFLTFSGALPSPFESPGISILKRKSSNISMDDSMHSPAAKRKRVSFGFPLSQTKEYIIDEEFTPFYMLPSNDSPCRRANRLKKLKLKRNKNQNDSAKSVANDLKASQLNDSNATMAESTSTAHAKGDEVSVKQIQEYLGMDAESYRAKQEKQLTEENATTTTTAAAVTTTTTPAANNHDSNSDDSSTESNDDDPEIEAAAAHPPQSATATATAAVTAKSLNEFSDDDIFSHLLSKYSPNDILKKFESVFDAKVLTKRLSTIMSTDKQAETHALEELAETHSESFLEHAITENLCSVICDRLTVKSPNGITDYTTEKINNDEQFASDFLDRVSVSMLRQKLMDTVTTSKREQHILLDDFLTALKDSAHRISPRTVDTGILPEHIHLWISKLFDQFKLTPEQYLQLTSIYIQKNPPATLDRFD